MGLIVFIFLLLALIVLALFVYTCWDEIIGAVLKFLLGPSSAPDMSRFSLEPPDGRVSIAQRRQLAGMRDQAVQDTLTLVTDLDREAEQTRQIMEAIVNEFTD